MRGRDVRPREQHHGHRQQQRQRRDEHSPATTTRPSLLVGILTVPVEGEEIAVRLGGHRRIMPECVTHSS
jgi:hypothetical protein